MKTAVISIDVQKGFHNPYWGERNNFQAEANIQKIMQMVREKNVPLIHVQHLSSNPLSPLRPGQAGVEFMDNLGPIRGERIFQKKVNSIFIGTLLEDYLKSEHITSLIMMGFTSDHCVSASVRMAANLGFKVKVVSDATVAFNREGFGLQFTADLVHKVSLSSLQGEFAELVNTFEILELIRKGENQ